MKREAIAVEGLGIKFLHRIRKASCLPDHWHCAIAQTDELVQSAGLKPAGHSKKISGGLYAVSHLI